MNQLEIEFFRVKKLRAMLLRRFLQADADLLKLNLRREKEIEVMVEKKWRAKEKKRENKLKTIEMNKRKWRLSKGEKKENAKSLNEVKKKQNAQAEKLMELQVRGSESKRYYH